jgi:hypothetical protein
MRADRVQGYPISLYLDTTHNRYIEEFNVSNFIGISADGKTFVTPSSDSVLPSITNKMLQQVCGRGCVRGHGVCVRLSDRVCACMCVCVCVDLGGKPRWFADCPRSTTMATCKNGGTFSQTMVHGGTGQTRADRLPGAAAHRVAQVAESMGMTVEVRPVAIEECADFSEVREPCSTMPTEWCLGPFPDCTRFTTRRMRPTPRGGRGFVRRSGRDRRGHYLTSMVWLWAGRGVRDGGGAVPAKQPHARGHGQS